MRTFYTGSDIEDLAASGVRQLEVGPGVSLTDAARELAQQLGIILVVPGTTHTAKAVAPSAPAKSSSQSSRPRGCQHGPLPVVVKASHNEATGSSGPVVDQLVEAISALNKRGG